MPLAALRLSARITTASSAACTHIKQLGFADKRSTVIQNDAANQSGIQEGPDRILSRRVIGIKPWWTPDWRLGLRFR